MRRFREPLAFLAIGIALIGLSRLGDGVPTDGARDNRLAWQQLLFIYGFAALLFASLSYVLGHLGSSVVGCLRASSQGGPGHTPHCSARRFTLLESIFLMTAVGIGVWLRWLHMEQPMRLDEAQSFMNFVNTHWTNVFLYPFPNNHVLNSIFERFSCALLGANEIGIRMPAMLFGVLMIPLVFMLARRLSGAGSGWLAAIGVAVWPYLIFFSTNGRGYTLLCALTLLVAIIVIDDHGRLRHARIVHAAILCAVGMLTMPSMLFAVVGLLLWVSMLWRLEGRLGASLITNVLSPFTTIFVGLTLLLYTPVTLISGGLQGVMANKEAKALPLSDFLHQVPAHLETATRALGLGVPLWVLTAVLLAGAWGVINARQRGRYAAAVLWPAMLGGAVLFFLLKRSIPFPRTWIFLIPFFFLGADQVFTRMVGRLPSFGRWAAVTSVFVVAILFGRQIVSKGVVFDYSETGAAPGATEIAHRLVGVLAKDDYVCAMVPANVVLSYELWRTVKPAEDIGFPRIYWVRRPLSGPSRGALDGWKTIVDAGPLVVDVWTLATDPPLAKEPSMDCWQPLIRRYATQP